MAPPSQLSIATQSVQRLVKEEASYHKELEQQQERIKRAENGTGENAEYELKQEQEALEETKRVFPSLRKRIDEAISKLEQQLEAGKESGDPAPVEEINKAKEAVVEARKSVREIA
ncbi:MAG: hypothetical protein M1820_001634 [Bogoriella megaspora]|nr:MAG: hypothetical protein M1820_001634 [Bogoriella megaspora]